MYIFLILRSNEEKSGSFNDYNQENISLFINNSLNRLKSETNSSESVSSAEYRKNRITIMSTRVCRQELKLPNGVYVVDANSAAADLSSSSMFTLSQVPYLFSTAGSDGIIRFWSCKETTNKSASIQSDLLIDNQETFTFYEWKLNSILKNEPITETANSQVQINEYPLALSCSYNGRFAVAFKKNSNNSQTTTKTHNNNESNNRSFNNFYVLIYECESTGGSAWNLESCISLEDIILPELDIGINFEYISGTEKPIKPSKSSDSFKNIILNNNLSSVSSCSNITNIISNNSNGSIYADEMSKQAEIPSAAAKISIKKKYLTTTLPPPPVTSNDVLLSKKLIKLTWASSENGSHLLTVCLGNQIFIYSCVKKENDNSDDTDSLLNKKGITKNFLYEMPKLVSNKSKNKCESNNNSLVKWILFRSFTLDSADDMQALPNQIKWVRDGLLIVGLNTEMQVFSQFSPQSEHTNAGAAAGNSDFLDTSFSNNNNNNNDLKFNIPKNHSVMDLNKLNKITNQTLTNKKVQKKSDSFYFKSKENENKILDAIQDSGLFMQAK